MIQADARGRQARTHTKSHVHRSPIEQDHQEGWPGVGDEGGKTRNGCQRHLWVDTLGWLLPSCSRRLVTLRGWRPRSSSAIARPTPVRVSSCAGRISSIPPTRWMLGWHSMKNNRSEIYIQSSTPMRQHSYMSQKTGYQENALKERSAQKDYTDSLHRLLHALLYERAISVNADCAHIHPQGKYAAMRFIWIT
jgi:hypothetical protein